VLWLFGQIWIWLLISFALGAALTGFSLPWLNRPRTAEQAPPTAHAEAAQHIETIHPPPTPAEWPPEPPETGHREGTLVPVEWPPDQRDEENGSVEEPAWPREEDGPSAEQPPGRGS
jgi:hypothetical protein